MPRWRPRFWGTRGHVVYTIVVFVALASLDNAALALIPAMVKTVSSGVDASETLVRVLVGLQFFITAVTAVAWGYAGDTRSRKPLLLWGTVIWAGAEMLSGLAPNLAVFAVFQLIAAVGFGSIASVGFSVISDFVGPTHRGLAMSFWGLSQGVGTAFGLLLASQLGAEDHRMPFIAIAVLGFLFATLYLFTYEAPRGRAEPELQALYEAGESYDYRMSREQLPVLFERRTNIWLILQGLTAQLVYGSLVWFVLVFQEKVIAEGYSEATGTRVGGLLTFVVLVSGISSVGAGWLGDRLQRRSLRARALIAMVGILAAIPFFLLAFWMPLRGLQVTEGAGTLTFIGEVAVALFTNPWVALTVVSAIFALVLTGADSPNWFALISDVNLPEHRGTVYGLANLSNGVGRPVGSIASSQAAAGLERGLPPPFNWAVAMSLSIVFFLPTGWMYWKASRTSPGDITEVRRVLRERGGGSKIGT